MAAEPARPEPVLCTGEATTMRVPRTAKKEKKNYWHLASILDPGAILETLGQNFHSKDETLRCSKVKYLGLVTSPDRQSAERWPRQGCL